MIQRLNDPQDPYHRPHDRWVQVPVPTLAHDGELTNVTVRKTSLRQKRKVFTVACTAFTVGLLMILMASPYRNEFMVPGPLSSNHAQILAGQGADRCAACHGAADGSMTSWISNTIAIGKSKGLSQSELCMKCHDKSLNPETSLNPHNVAPTELAKLTAKYEPASFNAGMVFQPPVHNHQIACSSCHREHHGSKQDLTALTDQQCQTCHQNTFHDFAIDHPEFDDYPLKRRSRIAFDHASHSAQHFPGKQTEFNCNQCHVDDSFQNVKQLASYEQACASCHQSQIVDSGQQGLALIALPMIDTEAIEAAKLQVGSWPLAATGDFDGPLPPIMRVMLAADARAAEVLERLGPSFDFADVNPNDPAQVKDAVELVWGIKRLLYDLALHGSRGIQTRLESVIGLEISDIELQMLVNNLDEPVFQNAVQSWLPHLAVEVAQHRFGSPQSARVDSAVDSSTDQTTENGSQLRPDEPVAGALLSQIQIRQSQRSWWPAEEFLLMQIAPDDGQLAANPLAGLIKPLDGKQPEPVRPVVRVPSPKSSGDRTGGGQGTEEATNSDRATTIQLKNAHADPAQDPELLAVNPLQTMGSKHSPTKSPTSSPIETDPSLPKINTAEPPQVGWINQPEAGQSPVGQLTIDQTAKNPPVSQPMANQSDGKGALGEPRLNLPSGWFRNDQTFQISYRPSGHADASLQAWIELVARANAADTRPETRPLFDAVLLATSIGTCRNCHTVDQIEGGQLAVNWRAEYRDPSIRGFTKFAHGPHMIQQNLQDCSHCHAVDPQARNHDSFLGTDAATRVSNFFPMKKSACSTCHQANQTNSGCTQCHHYHVGSKIIGSR